MARSQSHPDDVAQDNQHSFDDAETRGEDMRAAIDGWLEELATVTGEALDSDAAASSA